MEVSRRAVVAAIPAFAIPTTASIARGSDAELIALRRQWQHNYTHANDPGLTDERADALWRVREDIESKTWAIPAQSIDGLMVKGENTAYRSENCYAESLFPLFLKDMKHVAGAL